MSSSNVNYYKLKLRQSLAALIESTKGLGSDEFLSLICALDQVRDNLRAEREEMKVSPVFYCRDCGKNWTIELTVAQERHVRPDNCPLCYNQNPALGSQSCWTDTFKFVDRKV